MSPAPTALRAVFFDLGGVVLEVDFARSLAAWARTSRLAPERLRAAFSMDEPYCRHETGALASAHYFAHVREVLALDCSDDEVLAGWNAMLVRPIPETVAMLDALRGRVALHALSNTNAAHLAEIERAFPGLLGRFDRVFASHELGHRKPQPGAFETALHAAGVAASQSLFLDDLQENVEAAAACGMRAEWVRTPAEIRAALARHGLEVP